MRIFLYVIMLFRKSGYALYAVITIVAVYASMIDFRFHNIFTGYLFLDF